MENNKLEEVIKIDKETIKNRLDEYLKIIKENNIEMSKEDVEMLKRIEEKSLELKELVSKMEETPKRNKKELEFLKKMEQYKELYEIHQKK